MNIKGAVERYLYLAIQVTIDLAEAIVAHIERIAQADNNERSFSYFKGERYYIQ